MTANVPTFQLPAPVAQLFDHLAALASAALQRAWRDGERYSTQVWAGRR